MENVYAEMLAWPLNEQAKYLLGFADGEGGPWLYRLPHERRGHHMPGEPHNRAITILNSGKRLLNTVQQTLKNLGIKSHMYMDVRKGELKATRDGWVLKILDRRGITKFAELIWFIDPKKWMFSGR